MSEQSYELWNDEETKTIWYSGGLDREGVSKLIRESIEYLSVGKFKLILSSYGGHLNEVFRLHDLFEVYKYSGEKTIICMGQCMSAALVLSQLFEHRFVSPNCLIMDHDTRMGMDEMGFKEAQMEMEVFDKILSRLNYKSPYMPVTETRWYTPEQAIKMGYFEAMRTL